jgi:hypothetical protein
MTSKEKKELAEALVAIDDLIDEIVTLVDALKRKYSTRQTGYDDLN